VNFYFTGRTHMYNSHVEAVKYFNQQKLQHLNLKKNKNYT